MELRYDVIVIGGGPAGAAAARACSAGGLRSLLVEKRKLPRQKACSGILVPSSIDLLSRSVGEIPLDVLAEPAAVQSLKMHFPSGRALPVPIAGLFVRRERFDQWLCGASGAEIAEETTVKSFEEAGDRVTVRCSRRRGEDWVAQCRVLIAADGGTSDIVRILEPGRRERLIWYTALQEIWPGPCGLESGIFHFFAFPEISPYPSAYVKDGCLFMEVVASPRQSVESAMARFREMLWPRLGVAHGTSRLCRLGCRVAYAAPANQFCFGTGRVLVAGEASGLLNLFGEGISSALASGALAGQAAVNALRSGMPAGALYRQSVELEKRRTLQQFRYGAYLTGRGVTFDFRQGLACLPLWERFLLLTDLCRWLFVLRKD